jgi:hypothetical protein
LHDPSRVGNRRVPRQVVGEPGGRVVTGQAAADSFWQGRINHRAPAGGRGWLYPLHASHRVTPRFVSAEPSVALRTLLIVNAANLIEQYQSR